MLLYTSAAVYVLGERGAWRGVERQKPPYRPRSGMVWRTAAVIFLFLFFLSAIPSPVSAIVPRFFAVLLLYYYRTHIVGSWVVGCFFSAACCAVLLLYYVLLLCCCCTGWLGGSVRGCVHGFVFFFFLCNFFSPAIPAPRWHRSAYHWLILIHQRFLHIRREWYSTSLIVNTYV